MMEEKRRLLVQRGEQASKAVRKRRSELDPDSLGKSRSSEALKTSTKCE
jgi:hypothetical protein